MGSGPCLYSRYWHKHNGLDASRGGALAMARFALSSGVHRCCAYGKRAKGEAHVKQELDPIIETTGR